MDPNNGGNLPPPDSWTNTSSVTEIVASNNDEGCGNPSSDDVGTYVYMYTKKKYNLIL